jgi:sporulation protein YlmC with PRC-barrel domain
MTKYVTALTVSLLSIALAGVAAAQTTTRPADSATPKDSTQAVERTTWTPQANAVESSKLIGTKVRTADGTDIGQIDQVVVNQRDGKVTHVILNKGGILGVGGEKLVLAWPDVKLQHDVDNPDRWIAVVDQAKIDRAPKYEARSADNTPSASPSTPPASKPGAARNKK